LIESQWYELEKYVNVILNIYGFLLNGTAFESSEETRKNKTLLIFLK